LLLPQWNQNIFCNTKLLGSFYPPADIEPMVIMNNLPDGLNVTAYENKQKWKTDMFDYSADLFERQLDDAPYRFGSYFILGANNKSKIF
jgi:hypothetical protein